MKTLATILKHLRLPLLSTFILAVLVALWWVQQNNVNSLSQQIGTLQQQIDALPATVTPKDKLALKKDQLTLEQSRVNAQNAIYGTLIQSVGGLFFFVTAYFTYRNVRATEEKQVTERFSKAIELLGSEKLEIRLGGIYALERIAKDSPKDHWTIMEVLTSFIKEKSPLQPSPNIQHRNVNLVQLFLEEQPHLSSQKQEYKEITTEVQAALTVIKRRDFSKEQSWQRIELLLTNLAGANLPGAYLAGANLYGAYLAGANLGAANFRGAYLAGTDLNGVNFKGADLREANLYGANFMGADLKGADFGGANFRGVIHLTKEQLKQITTDNETRLPDYL